MTRGIDPDQQSQTDTPSVWDKLCAPFDPSEIEKLPKPLKRDSPAGVCDEQHRDRNGVWCGGWHGLPAIHLDYVGHAGITMRLNDAAGPDGWSWEPAYRDIPTDLVAAALAAGQPEFARYLIDTAPARYTDGGLWIRLTIHGVVKFGFGDAGGKSGPNAVKEIIGDALRNAAMRFGVGTYLWSKSDAAAALLAGDPEDPDYGTPIGQGNPPPAQSPAERVRGKRTSKGDMARAMAMAVRASESTDVDAMISEYKAAETAGWLEFDIAKALHVDLMDAVGITHGGPVTLHEWMAKAGGFVRSNGGLSVADHVRAARAADEEATS